MLKKLFACLIIYRHNLQILHWQTVGSEFDTNHNLMEDYVNKFTEFIDDVAEITLMMNENPLGLKDCINTIDEDEKGFVYLSGSKTYNNDTVIKIVTDMFNTMIELYEDTCKEDLPDDIISKLQEHQYWIRKECQFKLKSKEK